MLVPTMTVVMNGPYNTISKPTFFNATCVVAALLGTSLGSIMSIQVRLVQFVGLVVVKISMSDVRKKKYPAGLGALYECNS